MHSQHFPQDIKGYMGVARMSLSGARPHVPYIQYMYMYALGQGCPQKKSRVALSLAG